jgi:hypothetical protein
MGTAAPSILGQFLMERELWSQLGLRREDLANRPAREVDEYILLIQLIEREKQARQQRSQRGR